MRSSLGVLEQFQPGLSPQKDRFAMNLIHMPRDEIFPIIGGVWHPGKTTPIHNHLTRALIGVYDGEERKALVEGPMMDQIPRLQRSRRIARRSNTKDT